MSSSVDPDDRFLLGFHATGEDIWQLLLQKLTVVEANTLKTNMTLASISAKDPQKQPANLTNAKGRENFLVQTILGGECSAPMFIESYLKSVTSIYFQKHRTELLYRLNRLFDLHNTDGVTGKPKGMLRFRDFPELRTALCGTDFTEEKPPVTAYTERPMIVSTIDFSPAAWEENGDTPNEDVIPVQLQVFSLNECTNLQFHPHLNKYSFTIHNALMIATIEWKSQSLLIHRVLHGRHLAPVVTSLHVPQTRVFYTASADRTVCGWFPENKYSSGGKSRLPSPATCLAYDVVSQMLLAGTTDGCVYVLPVTPRLEGPVKKVSAHTDWCMSIVTLPELEQVATCGLDGTVKIWTSLFDLRTTKTIREESGEEKTLRKMRKAKEALAFEYNPSSSSANNKETSSASSVHGGGLTHMSFSASQKMIFAIEGGRHISCWNVFLPSPSDVLRFHDKPVVGTCSFQASQELITADISGRIAVWDMHRALTTQRLGGPESEYPCGPINSIAYDPHRGSVTALGSKLFMFVPEQGTFSPLFELPLFRIHYAKLSRTIVVPTGNRVVVMDLLTSSTRNVMTVGTEEIASSTLAAREHIIIGTTEGSVYYSPLTHWRPSTICKLDDSVVAVFDLGPNSRCGAQGEENSRVLTVTKTGNIAHMAYGNVSGNYARNPPKHFKFLAIDLVNLTSFSKGQYILYGTMGNHLEAWDLTFTYQKASESLPCPITALTCVDEINGLVIALADGTIRIYNSASVLPIAHINPSATNALTKNLSPSSSPSGAAKNNKALTITTTATTTAPSTASTTIRQLVFNPNTCTIAVVRDDTVKCFSCERLVQGLQRSQHDAPFSPSHSLILLPNVEAEPFVNADPFFSSSSASFGFGNGGRSSASPTDNNNKGLSSSQSLGTVRSLRGLIQKLNEDDADEEAFKSEHTLTIDMSSLSGDEKPLTISCQWKERDQTIFVAEMDASSVSESVERLAALRRWWLLTASSPIQTAIYGTSIAQPRQSILKSVQQQQQQQRRSSSSTIIVASPTSALLSGNRNQQPGVFDATSPAGNNNSSKMINNASFAESPLAGNNNNGGNDANANSFNYGGNNNNNNNTTRNNNSSSSSSGLISLAESFIILPSHIHVPVHPTEALLDGMVNQAIYAICDPFPKRGAVTSLEQTTWNHRIALGRHTLDALKWLAISVGSALHAIHQGGFVALFGLGGIRYVCPNYKLCLEGGLFTIVDTEVKDDNGDDGDNTDSGDDSSAREVSMMTARPSQQQPQQQQQSGAGVVSPPFLSPRPRTAAEKAIDAARRQVPEVHVPPEGIHAVLPSIDMWLLGLALFKACSGRAYDITIANNNNNNTNNNPNFSSATSASAKNSPMKNNNGKNNNAQQQQLQQGNTVLNALSSSPNSTATNTNFDAYATVFDRHALYLHPSVRHDMLLMMILKGLLQPDPKKRMTSTELLTTASDYGEGIKRVVKTVAEAEALVMGATVLDEVVVGNNVGKRKGNDTIVTFDQQLPSVIFVERPAAVAAANSARKGGGTSSSNNNIGSQSNLLLGSTYRSTGGDSHTNDSQNEFGSNSNAVNNNSMTITLLQFAPPAHLRIPSVPNPIQVGATRRHHLVEVSYDDLAVKKVGIEGDLKRDRKVSNMSSFAASAKNGNGAMTRQRRVSVAGEALSLIRNNSGFCNPANESLASGPIYYHPVLENGQFTHAVFVESLQVFLVAEFDKLIGCSYVSLRRNLTAHSYAQALGDYYRKKVTASAIASAATASGGGGGGALANTANNSSAASPPMTDLGLVSFRKYDAGPERMSPYATLVVAIYPPNNRVQCLGGIESSDVEAAVTKRAGAGSVAAANSKDNRTVESETNLQNRAFEKSGDAGGDSSFSSSDNDDEDDSDDENGSSRRGKSRKHFSAMSAKERSEHARRKIERLEKKTQALARDEAMKALKATLDFDDDDVFHNLQKQTKYKPERLCPFFTESQATAEILGVVSTVPPPDLFYMKGWHRNRPMSRLREGKSADPTAFQPRLATVLPVGDRRHQQLLSPSSATATATSPTETTMETRSSRREASRLPPLRTNHNEPLRSPISVRTKDDDLLFVTKKRKR